MYAQYIFLITQIIYPMIVAASIVWAFGLDGYGRFSPLMVLCSLLAVVIDFGSNIFGPRRFGGIENERTLARLAASLMVFRLILGCILILPVAIFGRTLVPELNFEFVCLMMIVTLFAGVLSSQTKNYSRETLILYVRPLVWMRGVGALIIIVLSLCFDDPYPAVAFYFLSALAANLVSLDKDAINQPLNSRLKKTLIIETKQIAPHGISAVTSNLTLQLPHVVAGALMSPVFVGAFHLGGTIVRAVASVPEPIGLSLQARIGFIDGPKNPEILRTRARLNMLQMAVAVMGSLCVAIFGISIQIFDLRDGVAVLSKILIVQSLIPTLVALGNIGLYRYISQQPGAKAHLWVSLVGTVILAALTILGAKVGDIVILAAVITLYEAGVACVYMILICISRHK